MFTNLIYLIDRIAIALYIFIGLAALLQWRRWNAHRWSYRATQFELEREFARYRSANSFTALLLLFELGLVVVGIQNVVAPTLRETEQEINPQVEVILDIDFRTPTSPPWPSATSSRPSPCAAPTTSAGSASAISLRR